MTRLVPRLRMINSRMITWQQLIQVMTVRFSQPPAIGVEEMLIRTGRPRLPTSNTPVQIHTLRTAGRFRRTPITKKTNARTQATTRMSSR
ncbi:hypothetical protein [Skermania piniformis]|uniref:Uncharacterized protein n=1 Tax=Skermania pinensis TaxID=39122 RepID=A0ABX8SBR8_9ACTN|nr:hypothetical protein [Skermania piniformis]QXQ14030.1 hypothetical protein KV203_00735 [Skermania piniformis]